jgi:YYY domain-containing protein
MDWLIISLSWYLFLLGIGLIFFPLTYKIFNQFSDSGYAFSKILAILFLSYVSFFLGTIKIISFNQTNLFLLIFFFSIINLLIFIKTKKFKINKKIIIFEEIIFFIAFLFWVFVRGQEPSIRSLEKFMDFGFINSILRTKFFPPKDIWYPPESINYYYFGHLTGALLIKLTGIKPTIGYNLILSTIFALGITQVFSIILNIINLFSSKKINWLKNIFIAILGTYLVNLGGNLHTIYVLTKGYPNENPIPFWEIFSRCNTLLPQTCEKVGIQLHPYWYANATRFIPYTIHEFPSYSYVVADLHGHVFDIPFVLLTLILLFNFFINLKKDNFQKSPIFNTKKLISINSLSTNAIFLGFLTAIHYMTNAFDGPIYLLLSITIFFVSLGVSTHFIYFLLILILSFIVFSLPFSLFFKPFISGIGVNCGEKIFSFTGKIGPFLFEKNNCQSSPLWMLFLIWGFFWINFLFFSILIIKPKQSSLFSSDNKIAQKILDFVYLLFVFGIFLVLTPEFFYIKDIYPAHFRANTMFKLGYQAFIMMSIASVFTLFLIQKYKNRLLFIFYSLLFIFIFIYPFYSIPSYYGQLNRKVELDGSLWLLNEYPEDKEIIDWLNNNVNNQPVILEAQGDSYTDYERISSLTGLPTVAGWWVHEWLWRGSPDFIGKRIPETTALYESRDLNLTKELIRKYNIRFIIVSTLEKQKYQNLNEEKFKKIGRLVFQSSNQKGVIYQVKIN